MTALKRSLVSRARQRVFRGRQTWRLGERSVRLKQALKKRRDRVTKHQAAFSDFLKALTEKGLKMDNVDYEFMRAHPEKEIAYFAGFVRGIKNERHSQLALDALLKFQRLKRSGVEPDVSFIDFVDSYVKRHSPKDTE